jgi:hypothetical protein
LVDDLIGVKRRRTRQPFVAAVRQVVVERERVGYSDAGKGEPLLVLEPRDLLG